MREGVNRFNLVDEPWIPDKKLCEISGLQLVIEKILES